MFQRPEVTRWLLSRTTSSRPSLPLLNPSFVPFVVPARALALAWSRGSTRAALARQGDREREREKERERERGGGKRRMRNKEGPETIKVKES
jgi:hypothetical protein